LRHGWLLALIAVPSTLLYMAYYWGPDGMSMRFLVPTFFIYGIAAVWLLKLLAESWRGPAIVASLVALLLTALAEVPQTRMQLQRLSDANRRLAQITDALKQHVPAGSIVLADRQVEQQLDFVGDWRLADTQLVLGGGRQPPGPDGGDDGAPSPGRGRVVAQR